MPSLPEDELWPGVHELDSIPKYRRILIGFAALISGAFFGSVGALLVYADLVGQLGGRLALWSLLGTALLGTSVFMLLVWLRLWFGPRAWLDGMLSRILLRSSGYLLVVIAVVLVCAALILRMAR